MPRVLPRGVGLLLAVGLLILLASLFSGTRTMVNCPDAPVSLTVLTGGEVEASVFDVRQESLLGGVQDVRMKDDVGLEGCTPGQVGLLVSGETDYWTPGWVLKTVLVAPFIGVLVVVVLICLAFRFRSAPTADPAGEEEGSAPTTGMD